MGDAVDKFTQHCLRLHACQRSSDAHVCAIAEADMHARVAVCAVFIRIVASSRPWGSVKRAMFVFAAAAARNARVLGKSGLISIALRAIAIASASCPK